MNTPSLGTQAQALAPSFKYWHLASSLLERFGFSLVRVNPCGDTRLGYTMPEAELRLAF